MIARDQATRSRTFGIWLPRLRRYGTPLGLLLIVGVFWALRPDTFMTVGNWLNISQQVSILGVIAFASTIVMVTAAFDLSVGALASLAGIVATVLMSQGAPVPAALALTVLVALSAGVLNGFLVAFIRITPFVATLGTLTIFGGVALLVSGGNTIFGRAIPRAFGEFGRNGIPLGVIEGRALMLPNLTLVAAAVFVAVYVLLGHTVFGRRLYAIGGNPEAARLSGIRVRLLTLVAFVLSSLGAGIGGLMLASRLASANPTQGEGLMLNAIAAVFLGITMSDEGEPRVLGTLVGVLILGILANGLTQLQINTYVQQVLTGSIIVLAVALGSLSKRT
ncbi:MAG: ABC transporter permease [Trueperaceae bacterium]